MPDIEIINYEPAGALLLAQLLEIYQQTSGGIRREKKMTLQELRDFLQSIFTSLTCLTINTGHGAVECYAMNQDVETTDSPTFAGLSVGSDTDISASIGRLKIDSRFADHMALSHYDMTANNQVAFVQSAIGATTVNTASGTILSLTESNNLVATYSSTEFEVIVATSKNPSGTWTATSDRDMKENFRRVSNPLQKVVDLSECLWQYNFKDGVNNLKGMRTQYVAQDLIEKGFDGHITEVVPQNEVQGKILGWEYGDEEYFEDEPVIEIVTEHTPTIVDDKIVLVPSKKEVQKTESKMVQEIQHKKEVVYQDKDIIDIDEDGNKIVKTESIPIEIETDELIIVEVEKQVPVMKSVRKTRRIVIKEGRMMLQVEQNLSPYFAPAIAELNEKLEDENITLRAEIKAIKEHLGLEA